MPDRTPGKIILVHGPSSSGKTTLCRALQARLTGTRRPRPLAVNAGAVPYEEVTIFFLDRSVATPQPIAG